MFFTETQPQNSLDRAQEAFKFFHNQAARYPDYTLTYDELMQTLGNPKQQTVYLQGVGDLILSLELDSSQVQKAMEGLADKGQGKVPAHPTSYFSALGNKAQEFSFVDASVFVGKEVLIKTGEGLAQVGDTVLGVGGGILDTIKSLSVVLPIVLVGLVVFIVVEKGKRIAAA